MRYESVALDSDQPRVLVIECPACATHPQGTGVMRFDERSDRWFVDYWCPQEKRAFSVCDPNSEALVLSPEGD
jgi:hypothetical protein